MSSPCEKCKYLSDDKKACMFLVHKDVPWGDGIEIAEALPGECYVIGEALERVYALADRLEGIQQELTATQKETALAASWIEELWADGRGAAE